jgi:hypothetical protein
MILDEGEFYAWTDNENVWWYYMRRLRNRHVYHIPVLKINIFLRVSSACGIWSKEAFARIDNRGQESGGTRYGIRYCVDENPAEMIMHRDECIGRGYESEEEEEEE